MIRNGNADGINCPRRDVGVGTGPQLQGMGLATNDLVCGCCDFESVIKPSLCLLQGEILYNVQLPKDLLDGELFLPQCRKQVDIHHPFTHDNPRTKVTMIRSVHC